MQEKLLIYLNVHHPERPSWAVIDADGVTRRYAYHDDAQGFATLASGKEVIAIVPSEDVLLTSVNLPKMSRQRLQQALPFALEEQLISDVETLHFAIGEIAANGDIPVAVVSRDKMQQWMSQLAVWKIQADSLVPAIFAAPLEKDQWHVMVEEISNVRTGPLQGMACDNNNLDTVIKTALQTLTPQPKQIFIRNYSAHPFAESLNTAVPIHVEHSSTEQFMMDVARNILTTPSINLLQSNFSTKKMKIPKLNNMQRVIYYLAMAVLILLFLYPLGSLIILTRENENINDQISAIYRQHFPQAKTVTAPKIRMEEKLHQLTSKVSENKLLLLLGYVGKGFQEIKNITLKRLDFQGSQLTLELVAATSADFSAFTDFLTRNGLQVRQQNATLAGERIHATLQVE